MTVQELMKQLLELPMDATIAVALDRDKMVHIDQVGVIPKGPLGLYKPDLAYLEVSTEEVN